MTGTTPSLTPMLTLPPELLSPIFLEAGISLDNLLISRVLLPYTLEALFDTVNLYSRAQIHSFSQAVQNTQHAAHVKRLAVSTIIDREAADEEEEESDDSDSEWESVASSVGVAGSVADEGDSRADLAVQSLGPVLDDIALPLALTHILRRLSNLESLACIGCETMAVTWDNFYQEGVLPKLASVRLQLQLVDNFTNEDNGGLFQAIGRLPSLASLEIQGPTEILPFDISAFALATPASRPIPARSWTLTSLELYKVYSLGTECCYLFEALAELEVLVIEAVEGPVFTRAIGLLPQTLRTLTLIFHYEADPSDPTDRRDHLPQLDDLATQFPNLFHLHLTGQIYSHKLFESLHLNTSLHYLLLGHGAPMSTASLLQLVQPDSPYKMTALKFLDLHVCFPRSAHQQRAAPEWTDEFPRKGAKKLARICEEVGVELKGSVRCALRTCDCERGACARGC